MAAWIATSRNGPAAPSAITGPGSLGKQRRSSEKRTASYTGPIWRMQNAIDQDSDGLQGGGFDRVSGRSRMARTSRLVTGLGIFRSNGLTNRRHLSGLSASAAQMARIATSSPSPSG